MSLGICNLSWWYLKTLWVFGFLYGAGVLLITFIITLCSLIVRRIVWERVCVFPVFIFNHALYFIMCFGSRKRILVCFIRLHLVCASNYVYEKEYDILVCLSDCIWYVHLTMEYYIGVLIRLHLVCASDYVYERIWFIGVLIRLHLVCASERYLKNI